MSDLDKAVELASIVVKPGNDYEPAAVHLARAVLAMAAEMERLRFLDTTSAGCMAPVVRAARAWADTDREYWEGHATSDEVDASMDDLRSAIRTLDAEARRG